MPRLTRHTPKYRLHRASGQAVVTLGGKDHYLGPHGSQTSLNEYDRLVGEWLQAGRRRVPDDVHELTVTELIARYWAHAKRYYTKNGRCTGVCPNIKVALRPVRRLYGNKPAHKFGPKALKVVRQEFVRQGLSRKYVNSQVGHIKRMFQWGVGEELIRSRQYQALKAVPGLRKGKTSAPETQPVVSVDDATVEKTLAHCGPVVGDMIRMCRLTGMRPIEVCLPRPGDVERTGDVWLYVPEESKIDHHEHISRAIAIGPRAQAILRPYLLRASDAYCFSPAEAEERRLTERHAARVTPLSCGNRPDARRKKRRRPPAERYTVDSFRRAIHRAADRAGVPRWSPNRLRHAAATQIEREFGAEAARVALGHTKVDMTRQYIDADLRAAREVAKKIG